MATNLDCLAEENEIRNIDIQKLEIIRANIFNFLGKSQKKALEFIKAILMVDIADISKNQEVI